MSYKEILVQTGSRPTDAARLNLAVDLAKRSQAALTGVFLTPPPAWSAYVPTVETGPAFASTSLAGSALEQDEAVRREAALAEQALRLAAAAEGLEPVFHTVPDDAASLTVLARKFDLTILPAPGAASAGVNASADSVALSCGGPVVVVHEAWESQPVGSQVMLAWDGSRESARAMKDALPLLKTAKGVDVVIVDHAEATRDAETALVAYLGKHGVSTSVLRTASENQPIGEALLRMARRLDSDLIVMGAYGHARLRELVLGGATQRLLQHARVPLFMSH